MRIGLLGGSFNPAHEGHRYASQAALRLLGLDEVWWLVSPQNPLKPEAGMAPYAQRLGDAVAVAQGAAIRVSDAELRLGTRFTVDTLFHLTRRHRRTRFVWLMGADNLAQIHRWRRWPEIFASVPIAVVARWPWSLQALLSPAARRYAGARRPARGARRLAIDRPPAWLFLPIAAHPASATAIRAARGVIS